MDGTLGTSILAMVLCASGCSGGGGFHGGTTGGTSIDCSPVVACGGDLTGSWVQRGSCAGQMMTVPCTPTSVDTSGVRAVVTFGGGMMSLMASGLGTVTYPLSCFGSDAGFSTSCDKVGGASPAVTCAVSGTGCVCTVDEGKFTSGLKPIAYTAANGVITIGSSQIDYCIMGNVLRLQATPGMSGGVAEYDRQ